MPEAFQEKPQGGSDADYKKWALAVSGVTRAWVEPRLMGAGTVGVYIMIDPDGSTSNTVGFPTRVGWHFFQGKTISSRGSDRRSVACS